MKRTIVALATGLLIGGATLGPVAASATSENRELVQRVERLEERWTHLCAYLAGYPRHYFHATFHGVC